jgi:hypothetical protein
MVEEKMLRLLVEAGASHVDAAAATELLRRGSTLRDVLDVVEFAPVEMKPEVVDATFAAELLVAQVRELVKVEVETQ